MNSNRYLIEGDLSWFNADLAVKIGLHKAIVIQKVFWWLCKHEEKAENFFVGRYWNYNSIAKWHEQFPFFSEDTVKNIFRELRDDGILLAKNIKPNDRTLWYSIDYIKLNELVGGIGALGKKTPIILEIFPNEKVKTH